MKYICIPKYHKSRGKYPPMFYAGKTVCITGASKGIGFEIANILLQRGATVHTIARSPSSIQNKKLIHHKADLLVQVPDIKHIEFDILILNVGANIGKKPFESMDLAEVEEALFMNVTVHLRFLKELVYKKVVFINSVTSMVGIPDYSLYCASKAFMSTLNDALVREGKDTYIIYPYKVNTLLFKEMRDFMTIDKVRLAEIIVRDVENGVKYRIVPCVFAIVPLLCYVLPACVVDMLIRLAMYFLFKPKNAVCINKNK